MEGEGRVEPKVRLPLLSPPPPLSPRPGWRPLRHSSVRPEGQARRADDGHGKEVLGKEMKNELKSIGQ